MKRPWHNYEPYSDNEEKGREELLQHTPKYPLEQVAQIKQKRLEEAEKLVKEKKELLIKEEEKLKKVQEERDAVQQHRNDKLAQLRHELDTASSSLKIQQMRVYLKEVDEKLKGKNQKVIEQEKQTRLAEQALEEARKDMLKKRQATEKMQMHRAEWEKEQRILARTAEERESDEIGTTLFNRNKQS